MIPVNVVEVGLSEKEIFTNGSPYVVNYSEDRLVCWYTLNFQCTFLERMELGDFPYDV